VLNLGEGGHGHETLTGCSLVNLSESSNRLKEFSLDEALRCWAQRMQLSEDDRESLHALPFNLRTVERDGFIVREGERPGSCNLILAGAAFRQKVVHNGARQIISFHFPGEFVDLQGALLAVNDHSVQALTACKLAAVPKEALLALIDRRPAIARALWYDTLVEGAIFREWVVNVGRRNARGRIAHLLCELAARLETAGQTGGVYELPITQEQIADATGMTSVHTNRTIQALRKEGLISWSGGRLVVHNEAALKALGDFSDLYLHRNDKPPRQR
jgi:CRP-like cAMP-binding protein